MKRWSFLQKNIPLYLQNPYIGEIVLVDETGEDYQIITDVYKNEPKVKVFRNTSRLGPFLNKIECMKQATFHWIALIDSDNFVDIEYFEKLLQVFDATNPMRIYMPCKALPNFDFSAFSGMLLTSQETGTLIREKRDYHLTTCFNTGNYILSKATLSILQRYTNDALSKTCFCCDVIYANTLLLKNDVEFLVVPEMTYTHIVHEGSVYLEYVGRSREISEIVHSLFSSVALGT